MSYRSLMEWYRYDKPTFKSSWKYRDFVKEPVADKPVDALPGVGGTRSSAALGEKGFLHAYQLLGQFLLMGRDIEEFYNWLESEFGFCHRERLSIANCLADWCVEHL